jgi:serine/threonine protein kinase
MDVESSEIEIQLTSESTSSRLEDKYEFLEKLGEGGMGAVTKARHRLLGHFVAIKKLAKEGNSPVGSGRFLNEAKAARRLKHENVVAINEFGVDSDGIPYAVMEYANGVSLSTLLHELKALTAARTIDIAVQIAKGLQHAHENGVIHRDIKPSNVIIDMSKKTDRVLIVDFGIAKIVEQEGHRLTQTGEVFGSPLYLSPQQALGQVIDHRTDIYSLGCLMYECLTGSPPFVADNAMQIAMKHINAEVPRIVPLKDTVLPKGLAAVINRCLSKSAKDRYQSAEELISALNAVKEGKLTDSPRRVKRSLRSVLSLMVIVVCCAAAIGLVMIQTRLQPLQGNFTGAAPSTQQVDDLVTQRFFQGNREHTRLLSEISKRALYDDQNQALILFQAGKFTESAYRCLVTVNALDDELNRLEQLAKTDRKDRENIRSVMDILEVLKNESSGFVGQSYLGNKDYAGAIKQFEKIIPFFRSLVVDRHWEIPQMHVNYEAYISALRTSGQTEKANQVATEYGKLREAIKRLK